MALADDPAAFLHFTVQSVFRNEKSNAGEENRAHYLSRISASFSASFAKYSGQAPLRVICREHVALHHHPQLQVNNFPSTCLFESLFIYLLLESLGLCATSQPPTAGWSFRPALSSGLGSGAKPTDMISRQPSQCACLRGVSLSGCFQNTSICLAAMS